MKTLEVLRDLLPLLFFILEVLLTQILSQQVDDHIGALLLCLTDGAPLRPIINLVNISTILFDVCLF